METLWTGEHGVNLPFWAKCSIREGTHRWYWELVLDAMSDQLGVDPLTNLNYTTTPGA